MPFLSRQCSYLSQRLGFLLIAVLVSVTGEGDPAIGAREGGSALDPAAGPRVASSDVRTLVEETVHLRTTEVREWAEFAAQPEARVMEVTFSGASSDDTLALALRQEDVKQGWRVSLNGEALGELVRNEQPLNALYAVPPALLREGANRLTIRQVGDAPDDVRVGPIRLHDRAPAALLGEARLRVTVRDRSSNERTAARLTVLDSAGALQPLGAESDAERSVRTGVVYTVDGETTFGVPAGRYTIYAGRGPEYSLDSSTVEVRGAAGASVRTTRGSGDRSGSVVRALTLEIERVVDTEGWIASDPHIHTVTHSGHGDATVRERLATLVGEGIELPVATDHNVHVDYGPIAEEMGLEDAFTPVIGNEVTTPVGHFNVFPVEPGADPPAYDFERWGPIFEAIEATPGVRMTILDHGRDVHEGYRPFGSEHFNAVTGRHRDGWPVRYDAMEIVNSSAQQIDVMRLVRDWFAVLNGGRRVTPIGSSDSHDVNRYQVGQGRTYVRVPDAVSGSIDVDRAVDRMLDGRVTVSEGLFAEIEVEGVESAGRPVSADGPLTVRARVQGPGWVRAHTVALYANGRRIRRVELEPEEAGRSGLKWEDTWTLDPPAHDRHLVVVARGPGVDAPYWPIPRPYQHEQNTYEPEVIAVTGATYVDADADGEYRSPRAYAETLVAESDGGWSELVDRLSAYDRAVAAQAGDLLRDRRPGAFDDLVEEAISADSSQAPAAWSEAPPAVRAGLEAYRMSLTGETAAGAPR